MMAGTISSAHSAHLKSNTRISGIDGVRYILCIEVALLHSLPSSGDLARSHWAVVTACLCRGAVPFFFIASGYFIKVGDSWSWNVLTRPLKRLLPVYLVWCVVYAAADRLRSGHWGTLTLKSLVTGGAAYHLWFIPALGIALATVPTSIAAIGVRSTGLLAVAIAAVGLAFGSYHEALHLPLFGGIRMTEGPLLVLVGHLLARKGLSFSNSIAFAAIVISAMLILMEEMIISVVSGAPFASHDITIGSYAFGVSLFMFALSMKQHSLVAMLASIGRSSLGVYALHLLFIQLWLSSVGNRTLIQASELAVIATGSATIFSLILTQISWTKPLVR